MLPFFPCTKSPKTLNHFSFFKRLALSVSLITCLFAASAQAQQVAPFKKGDRVVFVGNSITDGGHYHSYIWLYYMTRFPKSRIDVYNAGIGGDVAGQIYDRLDSDVFAHRPTVMTLTFGMNDTGYQLLRDAKADSVYNIRIATSKASFEKIQAKLKAHPETRKIMIATSPYDNTSKMKAMNLWGKNASILKVIEFQHEAAKANNWEFVDFNTPMVAINQREQQRDSVFTLQGSDRIHPTNDAQMVMAYIFLKAQGMAGKKVAEINVDANGKLNKTDNCLVTNVAATSGQIKFNYLANALPYPVDTVASGFGRPQKAQDKALALVPFTDEMNQELLMVKSLKADQKYQLKIDKTVIGTWTGKDFAAGINMATLVNTPQYQQALAVMQLNEQRWETERHLREYYWMEYSILQPKGLLYNDSLRVADSLANWGRKNFFVGATLPTYRKARLKPVRDAWKKEIALLTDEIYRANQPVLHHFEIDEIK